MRLTTRLAAATAMLLAMSACEFNSGSPAPAPASVVVQPAPTVVQPGTGTVVVQPQ